MNYNNFLNEYHLHYLRSIYQLYREHSIVCPQQREWGRDSFFNFQKDVIIYMWIFNFSLLICKSSSS